MGQIQTLPDYAELHCLTNFSFLRGASHPEELVTRAATLGYCGLAITDECSVAGIVRAHTAAREQSLKIIVGSEFLLADGLHLVLLAPDRRAYGELCALITLARRNAPKGEYRLDRNMVAATIKTCLALWPADITSTGRTAEWFLRNFPGRAWIAVEQFRGGHDHRLLAHLRALGGQTALPLTAAGNVHMHTSRRRMLQDALTAIRHRTSVAEAGRRLFANGERVLRERARLARIFPPEVLAETVSITERCSFDPACLRYEYPKEIVPDGETATSYLRRLTERGMATRWPKGTSAKVKNLIEHELALITELHYEPYFLTVYDIVRFARNRGILCQGRGSAANSAVCFCLGITEVDPARMQMLFERFISKERNEPPDIDVDFEHQRREEVIQYLYRRYGRDRAALAATVVTYRPRSAIRDLGKALGLTGEQVDRLAKSMTWWEGKQLIPERLKALGFDTNSPKLRQLAELLNTLVGFPRHLSQHVGGFVISRGPLSELVPVENAQMPGRTVIQWDKDDLESLGLLKVDVLALGMLSAIRSALALIEKLRGRRMSMADIPAEDPAVYRMIQAADTIGVFQIESRAQMAMLPRLKPSTYYDLVIEVAIVRPGPIQGGMVHPYLRRRQGKEPVSYPSAEVKSVLERTLGVPIFQEQVMQLAVVAAGFTPGEADQLRRAMAAWRRRGGLGPFESRLINGMRERGYGEEFARSIFRQIQGFGEYGFPESHSASFAFLVYVSAWLKKHEPAAFTCALLNSQPMGFYAPAQLVRDAQAHGVEVRPVDVNHSDWLCTLKTNGRDQPALQLGFNRIKGFAERHARMLMEQRGTHAYLDVAGLAQRSGLGDGSLRKLADAGALAAITGHRHRAAWDVAGIQAMPGLLTQTGFNETPPRLKRPTRGQDMAADYANTGLSLNAHPMDLLRNRFQGFYTASALRNLKNRSSARAAGLVLNRQRPGTATGVIFMTLEDETGFVNVVVWERVAKQQRAALLGARLLAVTGHIERDEEVVHLIARRLTDLSHWLGNLSIECRDFH